MVNYSIFFFNFVSLTFYRYPCYEELETNDTHVHLIIFRWYIEYAFVLKYFRSKEWNYAVKYARKDAMYEETL